MANILILGGGFGGLIAAEQLAATLDSAHQITLVAPNRKFIFYPALVHLAFGECESDDITFDLSSKLKGLGARYVQGEMTRIHPERRTAVGNRRSAWLSQDGIGRVTKGQAVAIEEVFDGKTTEGV